MKCCVNGIDETKSIAPERRKQLPTLTTQVRNSSVAAVSNASGTLPPGCIPECPGCVHRLLSAEESARRKAARLRERLGPPAERLDSVRTAPDDRRWNYRDRVCLHAAWTGAAWALGLRRRERVIGIPDCPVHSERVRTAARLLAGAMPPAARFPLVYFVQTGAQITLVLKCTLLPGMDWLTEEVRGGLQDAGVEGLWLHLHPCAGKKVLAKRTWVLVWGEARSRDRAGLWYGPAAFQQLMPVLADQAADDAAAWLAPAPGDTVVDLYCGYGSTLRRWIAAAARTCGTEWSGEAVACAEANAPGAALFRGLTRQRLPQLRLWASDPTAPARRRLLYANPPRAGMERAVLEWIVADYRPERMAMLSCHPATLRRDLAYLGEFGYTTQRLIPFDFFPQTHHIEALALLDRKGEG